VIVRNTGSSINANRVKDLTAEEVENIVGGGDVALAVKSNLSVMQCLGAEIATIEVAVKARVKVSQLRHVRHGDIFRHQGWKE
jgi:hypothetical protein